MTIVRGIMDYHIVNSCALFNEFHSKALTKKAFSASLSSKIF